MIVHAETLENNANRVLSNLRLMRGEDRTTNRTSRKRIAEEMAQLFRQKRITKLPEKKQTSSWTHRFVCLAQVGRQTIPTTAREKDALYSAGLGEKKVVFSNADCTADEFKEILITFPKLRYGGGYQLCKCRHNSRELETLSSAAMSSPQNLRDFGGNSRTYIRPLQKDLNLSQINIAHDVVSLLLPLYIIHITSDITLSAITR